MHCPICGSVLIEVIRKQKELPDFPEAPTVKESFFTKKIWKLYREALEAYYIVEANHNDNSVWYKCDNCKCFGDDYPLILHHPKRGDKSAPGDSWSLSWIK